MNVTPIKSEDIPVLSYLPCTPHSYKKNLFLKITKYINYSTKKDSFLQRGSIKFIP
ncbi:unnamed protein product [Nezara viridula]|uniref:Uncharacterized protein n=1 Tax=Nezara viridula TaxID=85310 RepID=A0A9P0E631_NEZVI|nr:unnamed protein product [Nezara viridula]